MPEARPSWQGWSQRDMDILRAHSAALGLQIQLPGAVIPNTQPEIMKEEKSVPKIKNFINHIVLILDASSSMDHLTSKVIQVVDKQVATLAEESKAMNQETRITIYVFADTARCVVWDMDVLRLPSIATLYSPYGNTALLDATNLALDDANKIPEMYGDHAHLFYLWTDGQENASGRPAHHSGYYWRTPQTLIDEFRRRLNKLPENYTVSCMVPDQDAVREAERYGFHRGNIAVWDATSARGLEVAGEVIRRTTTSYMQARATGTRSTTKLFDIGANVVNAQAILDAGLKPLDYSEYDLVPIPPLKGLVKPADYDEKKRRKPWKAHGGRIDEFVQNVRGGQYIAGQAYYQLVEGKTERIQPSKNVAVVNKKTERVYTGPEARKLIGLPSDMEVRVKPTGSDDYLVYVQSKSPNRLLVVGSKLLIMNK